MPKFSGIGVRKRHFEGFGAGVFQFLAKPIENSSETCFSQSVPVSRTFSTWHPPIYISIAEWHVLQMVTFQKNVPNLFTLDSNFRDMHGLGLRKTWVRFLGPPKTEIWLRIVFFRFFQFFSVFQSIFDWEINFFIVFFDWFPIDFRLVFDCCFGNLDWFSIGFRLTFRLILQWYPVAKN